MQNSLFDPAYKQDSIPEFIRSLMEQGAALSVSISGGKDSDAMLRFLAKLYQANGWKGGLSALFCELGRIEWLGVTEHISKLCRDISVPLVRLLPKRSMIEEWQHRYETIISKQEDKPFWSSAAARYCTDREKTQTANKFLRSSDIAEKPFWSSSSARFCTKHEKTQPADKLLRGHDFVVCAIGLRAEESSARAKKPRYQVRNDITSTWYKTPKEYKTAEEKEAWAERAYQLWLDSDRKGRFAITWHPIHHWTLEKVWTYNGTSSSDVAHRTDLYRSGKVKQAIAGFPCHWVYATGNTRLSCSMCVLASTNDIINGAKHNPWTWAELSLMEVVGGWGFQQSRWLASLSGEVLEMSLKKRKRLHRTLQELSLVEPLPPAFLLSFLLNCRSEHLVFWTDAAFLAIAQLISQWMVAQESE